MITKPRSLDEETLISSKYFPQGKVLVNLFNPLSKIFAMIKGYTEEFVRVNSLLNLLLSEFNIYSTTEMIEEWETAVGIPDGCFIRETSLERRRAQVIAKIKADGVQSAQDIIDVVAILGFTITITSGSVLFPFPVPFPWSFLGEEKTVRFTVVVNFVDAVDSNTFPVEFPWSFQGSEIESVKCFIETLVPANCQVIYNF